MINLIRRHFVSVLILCCCTAILARLHFASETFLNDDAYLTLRAAKYLMRGEGLVSNAGEIVIPTTTPPYAVILAAVCILFNVQPDEAYLPLNFALSALSAVILYTVMLTSTCSRFFSTIAVLLFSLSTQNIYSSTTGMETPLFTLVILAATFFSQRHESRAASIWAAIFSAITFLVRPEGIVLIAALMFMRWHKTRSFPVAEVVACLVVLLPYFATLAMYYGSLVPQSVIAKRGSYIGTPGAAFLYIAQYLVWLFVPRQWSSDLIVLVVLKAALIFLFFARGFFISSDLNRGPHLLLVFSLATYVLYSAANPTIFEWYVVPIELGFICAVVISLWNGTRSGVNGAFRLCSFAIAILFVSGALLRYQVLRTDGRWLTIAYQGENRLPFVTYIEGPRWREDLYIKAAKLITPNVPETSVLAPESGTLAYYSEARLVSSIGHVNPEVTDFLRARPHLPQGPVISLELVQHLRPHYVISKTLFIRKTLLRESWFWENYQLLHVDVGEMPDEGKVWVFRRR